ncbi:hypothetical protein OMW55_13230 [Sphingomonas sp. BN140010]|uniref:Uncharacterized protein n=1 Tax=Sphingomonas arvum TaxID=2992113 RepID=A0ABT3JI47_9SPHN|nr:hypothetical protein [Sphingomonas sp. BN140010]MCW3798771.1 hypothetical protein [Sphingomonas sp. BN140010]
MGEVSSVEVRAVSAQRQGRQLGLPLLVASATIPLGLVLFATFGLAIPPRMILGDPATFTEQPSYLGLVSDMGFLGWWTAAVACLLAWSVDAPSRLRPVLLAGGLLSAILCLDDLMLLHEWLGEKPFFLFYAIASITYVWRYRAVHRQVGPALLAGALVLLATSLGVDAMRDLYEHIGPTLDRLAGSMLHIDLASLGQGRAAPIDTWRSRQGGDPMNMSLDDLRRIVEDGTKFAGIVTWAAYHVVLARFSLTERRTAAL